MIPSRLKVSIAYEITHRKSTMFVYVGALLLVEIVFQIQKKPSTHHDKTNTLLIPF